MRKRTLSESRPEFNLSIGCCKEMPIPFVHSVADMPRRRAAENPAKLMKLCGAYNRRVNLACTEKATLKCPKPDCVQNLLRAALNSKGA